MTAFFRQRRKFALVFLLIVAGGVNYIAFTKPEYEASGSLLVKFGRDATPEISRMDSSSEPQIITQGDRRETIESDIQILQSHGLLYEVVRAYGPDKLYPGISKRAAGADDPVEAAIRKLWNGGLIVKSNPQSDIIQVWMVNQNANVAAFFIHDLFRRFIERQSEVFNKPQTNFLDEEVKRAAEKLEGSQKELELFKEQNGISSFGDEMANLLRQKSEAGTVALGQDDDAWDQLSAMEAKEKQMLATYLPNDPSVIRQHEAVMLAKKQLHQRRAAQESLISASTTRIDKRIAQLEAQRSHYDDLVRQVEIDEQNYKNFDLRSENARINELLNRNRITPIVVVDEPAVPDKPARPRKKLILAMSLLAGLVLGAGTALVFETLDSRFSAPGQISEVLGVPVMANFG